MSKMTQMVSTMMPTTTSLKLAGRLLSLTLIGVMLTPAAPAWARQGGPPPAAVFVEPVKMETLERMRSVTGELRPLRQTVLASQEDGWVVEILPREGDLVQAGSVVARMDDAMAKLELSRAEAVLAKWEADVQERDADLDKRDRDLKKYEMASSRDGASATEVADARSALAAARARIDQSRAEVASARAEVGLAQKRLDDLTIKAPMTARVASRRTEVGQWLQKGDPVIELIELTSIDVWLNVPESLAPRLQEALTNSQRGIAGGSAAGAFKVQIVLDALGETREGSLVGIVPRADALSRLVPVRVLLDNKNEALRPGMSVTGLVPTGLNEPTLTVPKDAVMRNENGPYVFMNAGGAAQIVRIEPMYAAADRIAIRPGPLAEGAEVVVEGNERLTPGQPLAATPRAAKGAEKASKGAFREPGSNEKPQPAPAGGPGAGGPGAGGAGTGGAGSGGGGAEKSGKSDHEGAK